MYKNLEEILRKKNISKKALAEMLGIAEKSIHNKLGGRSEFTLAEVKTICSVICPEYRMEYVFETMAEDEVA